jgi:hypothetical protein
MIDFDDTHRRYWRGHRGDLNAAIPVTGCDLVTRGGKRYAVLYDADRKPVAAYEVVERLFAVKDEGLVETLSAPELQSRHSHVIRPNPLNRRESRRVTNSW